jgi:hypothetical protein
MTRLSAAVMRRGLEAEVVDAAADAGAASPKEGIAGCNAGLT